MLDNNQSLGLLLFNARSPLSLSLLHRAQRTGNACERLLRERMAVRGAVDKPGGVWVSEALCSGPQARINLLPIFQVRFERGGEGMGGWPGLELKWGKGRFTGLSTGVQLQCWGRPQGHTCKVILSSVVLASTPLQGELSSYLLRACSAASHHSPPQSPDWELVQFRHLWNRLVYWHRVLVSLLFELSFAPTSQDPCSLLEPVSEAAALSVQWDL